METNPKQRRFSAVYSMPFLLGFGLSVLILITDKNLQTDFGTMSSGYFVQWYYVLAMAVADLVGADCCSDSVPALRPSSAPWDRACWRSRSCVRCSPINRRGSPRRPSSQIISSG